MIAGILAFAGLALIALAADWARSIREENVRRAKAAFPNPPVYRSELYDEHATVPPRANTSLPRGPFTDDDFASFPRENP
ncbi:MAG: hypothetical protein IAI48_00585 [Candidatus Eremiobacteraeota bacterium]|nr:hypothetical protein [Candidatus Eremiobacteraeota bacterium]